MFHCFTFTIFARIGLGEVCFRECVGLVSVVVLLVYLLFVLLVCLVSCCWLGCCLFSWFLVCMVVFFRQSNPTHRDKNRYDPNTFQMQKVARVGQTNSNIDTAQIQNRSSGQNQARSYSFLSQTSFRLSSEAKSR